MLLDGGANEDNAPTAKVLWNLHYHQFLNASDLRLVEKHAGALLSVSGSLQEWRRSRYGTSIHFVDHESLSASRAIWSAYLAASKSVTSNDDPDEADAASSRHDAFTSWLKKSRECEIAEVEKSAVLYAAARATAPVSRRLMAPLSEASNLYASKGVLGPSSSSPDVVLPNPLFAAALSDTRLLAPSTNPLVSFHLATSAVGLTELSPLRLPSATNDGTSSVSLLFESAVAQFSAWTAAFRRQAGNFTIRFISADCLALCHTLQHNQSTGKLCANWYRGQLSPRPLTLDKTQYGRAGDAPKLFDVIETSNTAEACGALNILVAARPLLKPLPSSAIYTDVMASNEEGAKPDFESLLPGQTTAASLLLGLRLDEYWTNATAVSNIDEYLTALSVGEQNFVQLRLVWKVDTRRLSGPGPAAICYTTLAPLLLKMYQDMFEQNDGSSRRRNYLHNSLTALIGVVSSNTGISASELAHQLMSALPDDSFLKQKYSHAQEPSSHPTDIPLASWKEVPTVVAVTLSIPQENWKPIYLHALDIGVALVELEGRIGPQNHYFDVHVALGTLKEDGSPDESTYRLHVEEDEAGWSGQSPLIATFYAPVADLLAAGNEGTVSLCLRNTPQNIRVFQPFIPSPLAILCPGLRDSKHVFVSRFSPNQSGYHAVGGFPPSAGPDGFGALLLEEAPSTSSPTDEDQNGTKTSMALEVDPQTNAITNMIGRVNFTSGPKRQALQSKESVQVYHRSALTVDVVVGNLDPITLNFPVPIQKDKAKTRVARKSCYIELDAPPADPATTPSDLDAANAGIVTPFYTSLFRYSESSRPLPTTHTIPHLNLDSLPILDLSDRDSIRFLTSHVSLIFSARERRLRHEAETAKPDIDASSAARLNFKESLFTMFMLASGLQGDQTGLFGISVPDKGGVHVLVLVSAIRLDGAAASLVLDAAVLPLTNDIVSGNKLQDFLLALQALEICTLTVDEAELALWKKVLPSFAERCRAWPHRKGCEYAAPEAALPLSLETGEQFLCSCGHSKFPGDFVSLPFWEHAARYATRVAISPPYPVAYAEALVDKDLIQSYREQIGVSGAGSTAAAAVSAEKCHSCGATQSKSGGQLKKCLRCLTAKYCSAECQKKDWKKHRPGCEKTGAK